MIHFKPFSFGRAEMVTVGVLVGLAVLVFGIATIPAVADWYDRMNEAWTSWAIHYGYLGSFLAAVAGNLTIVIIFPYTIVTFFLATSGLDPIWLGLVTGTGALIGELSGYLIGRWGARKFQESKPEAYDALEKIVWARPKFVSWLLFIFSSLPLPDDVLFIPLGMLRYSFWKLVWPSLLGKILANLTIAYFGTSVIHVFQASSVASPTSLASQLGTLVFLTLAMYALFKLDWTKMMHRLLDSHPSTRQSH